MRSVDQKKMIQNNLASHRALERVGADPSYIEMSERRILDQIEKFQSAHYREMQADQQHHDLFFGIKK